MVKTIAVDSDLLVYQIGYSCQDTIDFGAGADHVFPVGDKKRAAQQLEAEADKLREHFGKRARIVWCLSDPKENFRKDVLPSYKQNRSAVPGAGRPLLFNFIRDWIGDNTESRWEPRLEADDLLGIMATGPERAIMVSIDKDLLTIPGILCNPKTLKPTTTDAKTAQRNHFYQTLVGDSVDNYKGCPGIGAVKAAKLLDKECTWEAVVRAFIAHYSTKLGISKFTAFANALQQARVAYILQHDDYTNKEIRLWVPQKNN